MYKGSDMKLQRYNEINLYNWKKHWHTNVKWYFYITSHQEQNLIMLVKLGF